MNKNNTSLRISLISMFCWILQKASTLFFHAIAAANISIRASGVVVVRVLRRVSEISQSYGKWIIFLKLSKKCGFSWFKRYPFTKQKIGEIDRWAIILLLYWYSVGTNLDNMSDCVYPSGLASSDPIKFILCKQYDLTELVLLSFWLFLSDLFSIFEILLTLGYILL